MAAAAEAMGKAVASLDALKTADALPPEMEALNQLLKAQATVKRREVQRQQAGNGSGNTNRNFDLSACSTRSCSRRSRPTTKPSRAPNSGKTRTRARSTRSRIWHAGRTSC